MGNVNIKMLFSRFVKKISLLIFFTIVAATTNAAPGGFPNLHVNCNTPFGPTINQVVSHAREGATIKLIGDCVENVVIKKGVTLDGQGTATLTPADSDQPTILVAARDVVITNLTIQGASNTQHVSITNQSLATVSNSDISGANVGIYVGGLSLVTLTGNRIYDNVTNGVQVLQNSTVRIGYNGDSNPVQFIPNIISGSTSGILFLRANGGVIGNQIINNQNNGIVAINSSSVRVANNELAGNNVGIVVQSNSSVDLAEANSALWGNPNFGSNTTLSIYCNSGYVSGIVGASFLPFAFFTGTCENASTP